MICCFILRFVFSFLIRFMKLVFNWIVLIIILNMCLAFIFPCWFCVLCAIEFALLAHKRFINWPLFLLLLLLFFFNHFRNLYTIFYLLMKMNWNKILNYICNFNFFVRANVVHMVFISKTIRISYTTHELLREKIIFQIKF